MIGGYSGTMVSAFGYERFFLMTAIMGIPVLFLVVAVGKAVCKKLMNNNAFVPDNLDYLKIA